MSMRLSALFSTAAREKSRPPAVANWVRRLGIRPTTRSTDSVAAFASASAVPAGEADLHLGAPVVELGEELGAEPEAEEDRRPRRARRRRAPRARATRAAARAPPRSARRATR
jgi:hypothetical protein